jgi:PAS domain S-box-containing protein
VKLRYRLVVLPLIAVFPAIALLVWDQHDLYRSRQQQLEQQVLALAKQQAAEVDRIAEGALQFLVALAQIPEIKAGTPECAELLSGIRSNYRSYLAIIRADLSGNITCSSIGPGPAITDRLYFRKAIETDGFSVGEYVQGRGTGSPSIHFSYPIRGEAGKVTGVIAAALDLQWFASRMAEKLPADTALNVADANGTMLVRLPENEKYMGQPIPEASRWIIHSPRPGVTPVVGVDGVSRLLGYVPIPASTHGLHVGISHDLHSAFADLRRTQNRGVLLIASGIVICLALGYLWGEQGIRRPVDALLASAQRWRGGDYRPSGRRWDNSELGQIGSAFDRLVGVVSDREQRLRTSEAELAEHQRYLAMVLDQVPAGIMQTLPDKSYGFVNRGFCALLGRSADQLLGHKFTEFTHPEDIAQDSELFDAALRERQPYCHRKRYLRPDGSIVWAENTVTHLDPGEGILAVSVDLSERMQAESVQKRLVDELNHRVKNILATVQALMTLSSRHSTSTEQLVKNFSDRIKALSRTHDLLTGTHWQGTTLAEVVNAELQPYVGERSISVEGPDVTLSPQQAVGFGLVFHELATNAAKYGGLARAKGAVAVTWSVQKGAESETLRLEWEERGVDGAAASLSRRGFGTILIDQSVASLGGELTRRFGPDGLRVTIVIGNGTRLAQPNGLTRLAG